MAPRARRHLDREDWILFLFLPVVALRRYRLRTLRDFEHEPFATPGEVTSALLGHFSWSDPVAVEARLPLSWREIGMTYVRAYVLVPFLCAWPFAVLAVVTEIVRSASNDPFASVPNPWRALLVAVGVVNLVIVLLTRCGACAAIRDRDGAPWKRADSRRLSAGARAKATLVSRSRSGRDRGGLVTPSQHRPRRRALAALGLCLVAATGAAPAQSSTQKKRTSSEWVDALRTDERGAALAALAQLGKPAASPLAIALADAGPEHAWQIARAFRALGKHGASAVPRLSILVRDARQPAERRACAAAALGSMGELSKSGAKALVEALGHARRRSSSCSSRSRCARLAMQPRPSSGTPCTSTTSGAASGPSAASSPPARVPPP